MCQRHNKDKRRHTIENPKLFTLLTIFSFSHNNDSRIFQFHIVGLQENEKKFRQRRKKKGYDLYPQWIMKKLFVLFCFNNKKIIEEIDIKESKCQYNFTWYTVSVHQNKANPKTIRKYSCNLVPEKI